MKLHRHQQRAGSVSDRSLSASVPTSAPSSALRAHASGRRRQAARSPTRGEGSRQGPISVRRCVLLAIVLQLQPRYGYCVQNGGGAYIEVENVRTTSLRTKGAYKRGCDVRTCNFEAVANLSQTRRAERHGGRSLQKAVVVPEAGLGLGPGRVARGGVDQVISVVAQATPPPAYAAAPLSTGTKTGLLDAAREYGGNGTGALRPPARLGDFVGRKTASRP